MTDPTKTPPIQIARGDWLFTCRMEAVQFGFWDKDEPEYAEAHKNDWYDNFVTLDGSAHSFYHCSLKPISEAYALWFNENKIYTYFARIMGAKVHPLTEWVEVDGRTLMARQSSDPAIRYLYHARDTHKSYQFAGLEIDGCYEWWYDTGIDSPFDITNIKFVWAAYEAYVQQRAMYDNLAYEGY